MVIVWLLPVSIRGGSSPVWISPTTRDPSPSGTLSLAPGEGRIIGENSCVIIDGDASAHPWGWKQCPMPFIFHTPRRIIIRDLLETPYGGELLGMPSGGNQLAGRPAVLVNAVMVYSIIYGVPYGSVTTDRQMSWAVLNAERAFMFSFTVPQRVVDRHAPIGDYPRRVAAMRRLIQEVLRPHVAHLATLDPSDALWRASRVLHGSALRDSLPHAPPPDRGEVHLAFFLTVTGPAGPILRNDVFTPGREAAIPGVLFGAVPGCAEVLLAACRQRVFHGHGIMLVTFPITSPKDAKRSASGIMLVFDSGRFPGPLSEQ
jgi:hypothetical protein